MTFFKGLSREVIIERLTAQDVRTIIRATDEGDFQFLIDVIQGNNVTQYRHMTPDDLMGEYHDRCDAIEQLMEDEDLPYDVM